MKSSIRCAGLAVLAALAATWPAPGHAAAGSSAPAASALEEIVVTARKREELLQEVPIAVSAFPAEALDGFGFRTLEDVALRTPGLQLSEQAGQIAGRYNCSIRFRGMNVNSEQAVYQPGAMFLDGIYVASGCTSLGAEDLERIEVVKGPQTVYYGRNTLGGAVNYVTRDPGPDVVTKLTASFAEDDDYEYTGSISGPLVGGKLGFVLSGRLYDRGALWVSNSGDGLGEQRTRTASLKLVANPIDPLTIRLRSSHTQDRDGPSAGGFIAGSLNDTCTGTTGPDGQPRTRYICGQLPGLGRANTANDGGLISYNTSLSPAAFPTRPDYLRTQLLENGADDPAIDAALPLDFYGLERDITHAGLSVAYKFASGLTLSGVYGHNRMEANWLRDFDFTDVESWWSTDPQYLQDDTYELRLTSAGGGVLTWVAGVSYYEMDATQSGNGGTAVTAFPVEVDAYIPLTFLNSQANNTSLTYKAVFGGVTWQFADAWSFAAEARYQEDEIQKGEAMGALITPDPLPATRASWDDVLPRLILQWQPTPDSNLYASYSAGVLAGDINTEYIYGAGSMRTPEQVESARLQVEEGADPYDCLSRDSSGNCIDFAGTVGFGDQARDVLDRERLDSFEIGWKQAWSGGRIQTRMALYWMEWDNQKGRVASAVVDFNGDTSQPYEPDTVDPLGNPCTVRSPADPFCNDTLRTLQLQIPGASELMGLEFEGTWIASDHLTLQAAVEWTRNEYTDFTFNFLQAVTGTSDTTGNASPRYPEWKGNLALDYTRALGGTGWEWFARGDLLYFGDYYVDESNLAVAPAQTLLNARTGVGDENLRLELFGYNLLDEDAYAAAGRWSDFSIPGNSNFPANQGVVVTPQRPRYFGIKLSYLF